MTKTFALPEAVWKRLEDVGVRLNISVGEVFVRALLFKHQLLAEHNAHHMERVKGTDGRYKDTIHLMLESTADLPPDQELQQAEAKVRVRTLELPCTSAEE